VIPGAGGDRDPAEQTRAWERCGCPPGAVCGGYLTVGRGRFLVRAIAVLLVLWDAASWVITRGWVVAELRINDIPAGQGGGRRVEVT